jgi:hypothetical protein
MLLFVGHDSFRSPLTHALARALSPQGRGRSALPSPFKGEGRVRVNHNSP